MLIPNKHSGYLASIRLYPGGKGGSSAPAPDPALIAAQIKSMGIQDSAIQDILRISQDMAPLQKEQLAFGLESARKSYGQAQDDRTWSLGKRAQLDTAQAPLLEEAKNFNESTRRAEMMAEADADIGKAFDSAQGQQTRGLQRMGVNPSSGKSVAMSNQSELEQAKTRSAAGRAVSAAAKAEGTALKTNAVNMLSGYPAMASSNTGSGFGYGTAGVGLANASAAGQTAGFNAAGGMAGQMGSNATGMWNAQANYKNNQDQIAASNDPFNTILGAAAGAGMAWGLSKIPTKPS